MKHLQLSIEPESHCRSEPSFPNPPTRPRRQAHEFSVQSAPKFLDISWRVVPVAAFIPSSLFHGYMHRHQYSRPFLIPVPGWPWLKPRGQSSPRVPKFASTTTEALAPWLRLPTRRPLAVVVGVGAAVVLSSTKARDSPGADELWFKGNWWFYQSSNDRNNYQSRPANLPLKSGTVVALRISITRRQSAKGSIKNAISSSDFKTQIDNTLSLPN